MVELKEKRLRKSLSEAKNEWQGQKDLNPRHAVLERQGIKSIVFYGVLSCVLLFIMHYYLYQKLGTLTSKRRNHRIFTR